MPDTSGAKRTGSRGNKKVSEFVGASFPPAAGASAWGVNLKTPRYTLLNEGPSPLEKLFTSDTVSDNLTSKRHRKHQKGGGIAASTSTNSGGIEDQSRVSSRVSPGAPYYTTSFSVTPKITDVNVWTLYEGETVTFLQNPPLDPQQIADVRFASGSTQAHSLSATQLQQSIRQGHTNSTVPQDFIQDQPPTTKSNWRAPSGDVIAPVSPTPIVSLPPPPTSLASQAEAPPSYTAYVVQPYVAVPQSVLLFETPRADGGAPRSSAASSIRHSPHETTSVRQPPVTTLRPTPFATRAKASDRGPGSGGPRLRRRILKRSSVSSQSTSPLTPQRRAVQARRRQHDPPTRSSKRLTSQGDSGGTVHIPKDTLSSGGSEVESILRTSRKGGRSSVGSTSKRVQDGGGATETRSVHFADDGDKTTKKQTRRLLTGHAYLPSATDSLSKIGSQQGAAHSHVPRRIGCTGC